MKKQLQKGFTLIELMIVVAIIGILASIALPAYQDYIARGQAAESVVLLGGARTNVEAEVATEGTFPAFAGLTTLGIQQTGKYGAITAAAASGTEGAGSITYTFSGSVNAGLKGSGANTVVYSRVAAGTWACTATIPTKYRPKGC